MNYFTRIEDGHVIVRKGGVYRQADLYRRKEKLFAKYGAGFVRLVGGGATSVTSLSWLEIDCGDDGYIEKNGFIAFVPEGENPATVKIRVAEV